MFENVDFFEIGDIEDLTLDQVINVKSKYNGLGSVINTMEILSYLKKITLKQVSNITLFDFFTFCHWLDSQMIRLYNMELTLSSEISGPEKMAGVDVFRKFGYYIMISDLAGGDITKIDAVLNITYSTAFTEMKLRNERALYEKRLMKQNSTK